MPAGQCTSRADCNGFPCVSGRCDYLGADGGDAAAGDGGTSLVDATPRDATSDDDTSVRIDGGGETLDGGPRDDARVCTTLDPCGGGDEDCDGRTDEDAACTAAQGQASCQAGACTIDSCNPGFADCDRDASTGCEADLTDAAHCGSCEPCAANQRCMTVGGASPHCDRATLLSVGESSSCSAFESGALACWGMNDVGQLGAGTMSTTGLPTLIPAGSVVAPLRALSGRGDFRCAIDANGALRCWGDGARGELNSSTTVARQAMAGPTPPTGSTWSKVRVGLHHACALASNGSVWCWGANDRRQADPSRATTQTVRATMIATTATDLFVGPNATCVAYTDRLECWGANTSGALGVGVTTDPIASSTLVTDTNNQSFPAAQLLDVALSNTHGCLLLRGGALRCFGSNSGRALGSAVVGNVLRPGDEVPDGPYADVEVGENITCAIRDDAARSVACWGTFAGHVRIPGRRTLLDSATPQTIEGLVGATSIAMSDRALCATRADGSVACIGHDRFGEVGGAGESLVTSTPRFASVARGDEVSAGRFGTCVRDGASSVLCAGAATGSRFPLVTEVRSELTALTVLPANLGMIALADDALCALGNNAIHCAGSVPTSSLAAPTSFRQISAGLGVVGASRHVCARNASAGVLCWGANESAQLGMVASTSSATPNEVPLPESSTTAESVSVSGTHSCATSFTHRAYCWGRNSEGQVGRGVTSRDEARPTEVLTLGTSVVRTVAGDGMSCAVTSPPAGSASLSCWGSSARGALGLGAGNESTLAPTRVSFGFDQVSVVNVESANDVTCAIVDPGRRLYCWGANDGGRVGDGTRTDRFLPVSTGLSDVRSVDIGPHQTCAVMLDRRVACWGVDADGAALSGRRVETDLVPISGT